MIRVQGLSRSYGAFRAVDDVGFSIARGEVVGLLGHNGAGKTTIMKMLTGYLEPSAGEIGFDGLDIREQRQQAQRLIGYLPENCPLYPDMTVADFLEHQATLHGMVEAERPAAIRKAIERTWLETKALQPIASLSRGYRQRVGVAQAILHEPDILILDEPTNGLDPGQIQQMRALIRELSSSSTVILSTHILQEVQAVCDRVLVIRAGRLVLDSRLDALGGEGGLLLTTDAPPERVAELLLALDAVNAIDPVAAKHDRYQYRLSADGMPAEAAPAVARCLVEAGAALYALTPESRDLETLFRELNERQEVAHA